MQSLLNGLPWSTQSRRRHQTYRFGAMSEQFPGNLTIPNKIEISELLNRAPSTQTIHCRHGQRGLNYIEHREDPGKGAAAAGATTSLLKT
jgi:hypothetical protein